MKTMALDAILAAIAVPSAAQSTIYKDRYGAPQGSATTNGNTTIYKDRYGTPQGSATTSGNTTIYTDRYGAPLGSSQRRR